MAEITKLGMLAGGGMMPVEIIRSCRARGIQIYVAALEPFVDLSVFAPGGALVEVPHITAKLGEVGKMKKFFQSHGVTDLVLAGSVTRPALRELIPDIEGVKMLTKVALKKHGDDGLLRSVIREIEALGFHIRGTEEVVPEMILREGVYGRVKPSAADMDDIGRGIEVLKALGTADVGQAVVVQEGIVLAVEAIEGTDAMISRAASLRKTGKAPVVVKMKKPGQDTRVDIPAIGTQTVELLEKYGMRGIALEADGIVIIEREAVIEKAQKAGIFLVGMRVE